jgi:type IV pilus assembly protein PilA
MIKILKNRKGVTLVELLAVLVILAVIAAIAIPTIGNLIDNQRENAAELSYENIMAAADLYVDTEEPAADFSIQDLITADRLEFDGTVNDEADEGGNDLLDVDIFNTDGDIVAAGDIGGVTFTGDIYINGYQVYTEA